MPPLLFCESSLGVITSSLLHIHIVAAGLSFYFHFRLPEVRKAFNHSRVGVEEDVSVVDQRLDALNVILLGVGQIHFH